LAGSTTRPPEISKDCISAQTLIRRRPFGNDAGATASKESVRVFGSPFTLGSALILSLDPVTSHGIAQLGSKFITSGRGDDKPREPTRAPFQYQHPVVIEESIAPVFSKPPRGAAPGFTNSQDFYERDSTHGGLPEDHPERSLSDDVPQASPEPIPEAGPYHRCRGSSH